MDVATGSDRALDSSIADAFERPERDYTASVDRCIDLLHEVLPGWSWHVGWNATGVLPYASLHHDHERIETAAPTVPLALLKGIVRAKLAATS
jgi:hypothetical protein